MLLILEGTRGRTRKFCLGLPEFLLKLPNITLFNNKSMHEEYYKTKNDQNS
jgi:hypothetical protein